MSKEDTKALKAAEKEQKKAEKAARKAEKQAEKARRKALARGEHKAEAPEAPVEDAPDPLRPRTEEELHAELEDLRSMVQGEIDKMQEDAPDADWQDFVKAAAYEKRNGIKPEYVKPVVCEICGEKNAVEGEVYCEDCMEDMKHYPFEWWQFIIPVMAVFFLVFGILLAHDSWSVYSGTADAQHLARQGKLMSALDKYGEINGTIEDENGEYGFQYLKNQVKILEKTGIQQYGLLSNFLEGYYDGNSLDKWYNSYARHAQERIDEYQTAYEYFEEAATNASDFDSLIKAYDKAIEGKGVNEAFANYYRYYACLVFDQGLDTQKKYVEAIKAAGKEYESLYLPLETEIALTEKDYTTALALSDELEKRNAEDTYAYVYRTVAYRMSGELGEAAVACDEGLKIDGTASTLNYQRAILYLLDNDLTLANAFAEEAHTNAATANNYVSACSIYALVLQEQIAELNTKIKATDDKDAKEKLRSEKADLKSTYESLLSEMEEYGYELSPDVNKILKGKKTVEEVFLKGEGDFAWS